MVFSNMVIYLLKLKTVIQILFKLKERFIVINIVKRKDNTYHYNDYNDFIGLDSGISLYNERLNFFKDNYYIKDYKYSTDNYNFSLKNIKLLNKLSLLDLQSIKIKLNNEKE